MRKSDEPIQSEFHRDGGSLSLLEFSFEINSAITRDEFVAFNSLMQGAKRSTADTFYIPRPISLWNEQFMLAVVFRAHTEPMCTGWSLTRLSATERDYYEPVDNIPEFTQLVNLLAGKFEFAPERPKEIRAAIWRFEWGIVSVSSVIQNASPYQINVAWIR